MKITFKIISMTDVLIRVWKEIPPGHHMTNYKITKHAMNDCKGKL